jgi:HAMP domain-containing protein
VQGGQALSLGVAIPDDELLTDARSIRDRAILATLLVILLALPFTYGAARLVSRPIRELAREAAAIRRFDFAGEVVTRSVVREVDDLARDLASMKGSVRRFLDIASVMAEEPDFERLLPRLVDETVGVVGPGPACSTWPGTMVTAWMRPAFGTPTAQPAPGRCAARAGHGQPGARG